ncbi:hypothetical protein [Longimicrobium sp.]|uniref:hypothetical protein n=1 Tax=Longimicrobium sp. TaxID=2029185 RepID=UPI002E33F0B3|nr:hypothetical protein [Longimicrobium sp.]HEX6039494.1 hypothetical protein [Longimicrobium sp.]
MPSSTAHPPETLHGELVNECVAMTRYLLASGAGVPADLVAQVDACSSASGGPADAASLANVHQRLVRLVHPAKPGSIVYLQEVAANRPSRSTLGTVPVVRQILGISLVCLAAFIGLGVFGSVATARNGALVESVAVRVFLQEIFWMSAAGLGASFATLFEVNQQITGRTYDPTTAPWLWVRLTLGVVAGFVLVALVPMGEAGGRGAHPMAKPTLAMLGGFSAPVVYLALNRLVESVESMFQPDDRQGAAARRRSVNAQVEQDGAESRISLAAELLQLQRSLAAGSPPATVSAELGALVERLNTSATAPAGAERGASAMRQGNGP